MFTQTALSSASAGKTTLIKCAAGLYAPGSGKVLIDGKSTYNSNEVRSRLFYVPDELFFPASRIR
ncbi:MAG: ATP-binding cassette domain-containing protein [Acutalibacteraceae bacterium]